MSYEFLFESNPVGRLPCADKVLADHGYEIPRECYACTDGTDCEHYSPCSDPEGLLRDIEAARALDVQRTGNPEIGKRHWADNQTAVDRFRRRFPQLIRSTRIDAIGLHRLPSGILEHLSGNASLDRSVVARATHNGNGRV